MNAGKRKHFHAKGIKNIFNNTNLKKKTEENSQTYKSRCISRYKKDIENQMNRTRK